MTFSDADAYGRFMGRFSEPLAQLFSAAAGTEPPQKALDVGCGAGALTAVLCDRLGAQNVWAIDPSEPFVEAVRHRLPGVHVTVGVAQELPFDSGAFDLTLAQLVVHFLTDPVAGIRELSRVTAPGGTVGACVWDHAGGTEPLAVFWNAVSELDPRAQTEAHLPGAHEGHLAELFSAAGLGEVRSDRLTVTVRFADFDEWWNPFRLSVGPAGAYAKSLDDESVARLRERCRASFAPGPITITASAWTAFGQAPQLSV